MSANFVDTHCLPEFDDHDTVLSVADKKSGLKAYIAIHRRRGLQPSFGATRWWKYPSEREAVQDAMRLSHLMSYKSALAGLPYGGAKGVIYSPACLGEEKTRVLEAYAKAVENLGGKFITGTDAGLTQEDILYMRRLSPFFVGLGADPVKYTALGICKSIHMCLGEVFGDERIEGKSFAIQGLGKIGTSVIELLLPHGVTVFASDISQNAVERARHVFPSIQVISPEDIYKVEADVFSPCALGGSLHAESAALLRCKAIVGGANNQLADTAAGDALHKRGILYAPDYVVNAGGLIAVTQEYMYGMHKEPEVLARIAKIPRTLREIFRVSRERDQSPATTADQMARASIASYNT